MIAYILRVNDDSLHITKFKKFIRYLCDNEMELKDNQHFFCRLFFFIDTVLIYCQMSERPSLNEDHPLCE
jgi:hypothetical protein